MGSGCGPGRLGATLFSVSGRSQIAEDYTFRWCHAAMCRQTAANRPRQCNVHPAPALRESTTAVAKCNALMTWRGPCFGISVSASHLQIVPAPWNTHCVRCGSSGSFRCVRRGAASGRQAIGTPSRPSRLPQGPYFRSFPCGPGGSALSSHLTSSRLCDRPGECSRIEGGKIYCGRAFLYVNHCKGRNRKCLPENRC
jgi:hypothetical protein